MLSQLLIAGAWGFSRKKELARLCEGDPKGLVS